MRYLYLLMAVILALVGLSVVGEMDQGRMREDYYLHRNGYLMYATGEYVKRYEREHGRYPSNDEGLAAVAETMERDQEQEHGWDKIPDEVWRGLIRADVADGRILSVWGDPLIYENRRGLPKRAFAASGVADDPHGQYSVKIDDGIYVWSLASRDQAQALAGYARRSWIVVICFALGIGVSLFLYVVMGRRTWARFVISVLSGITAVLLTLAIAFPVVMRACYDRPYHAGKRTLRLTKEYLAVMDAYHERGVISDASYTKLRKAMEKEQ